MANSPKGPSGAPQAVKSVIDVERSRLVSDLRAVRRTLKNDSTISPGDRIRRLKDLAGAIKSLAPPPAKETAGRLPGVILVPDKAAPEHWRSAALAEVIVSRAQGDQE